MYVTDNDGYYPPGIVAKFEFHQSYSDQTWLTLISPYLKKESILRCPDVQTPDRLAVFKDNKQVNCYAYNAQLDQVFGSSRQHVLIGKPETALVYPALTITCFDARVGIIATRSPDLGRSRNEVYGIFRMDFLDEIIAQTEGAIRHHGGANYVFADGHASWLKPTEIRTGRRSDGIHPGFGL